MEKTDKINVILVHDGFEKNIRNLKEAIDILECEASNAEHYDIIRRKFDIAIDTLRAKMWEEFNTMCGGKAEYEYGEYRKMLDTHWERRKAKEQLDNQTAK